MASNYVPQVDYTSRDYEAIRNDLIALIPNFAPKWTNRDPADFGMTMIELFSYIGDELNFYIDRALNESFLSTASQRNSVLQIAKILGYVPTGATAATVLLTFQNSTNSAITVPAKTQVATSTMNNGQRTQIVFETDTEVVVPAKANSINGSATVYATQGETILSDSIGTSDGSANQQFELGESPVINGSVSITISGVNYSQVPYLIDHQEYDPVFIAETDADNVTYVTFGDGISGRIPPNGAEIFASYRVGGGVAGNVSANTIKYIISNQVTGLTVINQNVGQTSGAASGGADPESTDSIRINAPQSIRALGRAVSLSDYSSLAIQVPGVAKAISIAEVYSSITLYIAPYGDSGLQSDGLTSSTVFNNLVEKVYAFFADKTPPGTTLTFQPPKYVPAKLKVDSVILPQYTKAKVTADIQAAIAELFAFDNVAFNDRITLQDVLGTINAVPGVSRANVYKLVRSDEEQTFSISNKVLTSNVATLTTSATHNLSVGQTVLISNVDTTFNGTYVVTATPASNTFSYGCIATNVNTTAVTGLAAVTALTVRDIICTTNELPQLGALELTTTGGIE
jgi:hypothetical protein